MKESKSKLKIFAIQYRLDGKDWSDPDLLLVNAKQSITNLIDRRDSVQLLSLDLYTVKYEPLGGTSYIPPTTFLAAKKAIINLKNEDECFR